MVDTNASCRDKWNWFSDLSSHIGPAPKSLQNDITFIVSTDKKLKSKVYHGISRIYPLWTQTW